MATYAQAKAADIEFVLEPTCGQGNFLLAAIQCFKAIKRVVGVEIYKPYVWETKFKILEYFLKNSNLSKPDITIFHANAFKFSYEKLAADTQGFKTLVIGNPPWVTNSELGSIDSKNLPQKSNFRQNKGLDAITGKGNFDIGEYISSLMLKSFHQHEGDYGFFA